MKICDFTRWDDVDSAVVGYVYRCGTDPVLVYDYEKLVTAFVNQGMDDEEAREWVEFNIVGAYIGPDTPMILERLDEIEEAETEG